MVGVGLAQIGEFAFVLANQGQTLGLISRPTYLLMLSTTAVTLVLTPLMLRLVPWLTSTSMATWLRPEIDTETHLPKVAENLPAHHHAVTCGYGQS